MKNKLVIILALALLSIGLVFANAKYEQQHRVQMKQMRAQQAIVDANSARVDQLTKEVTADRDALLAQCKVGVDSWNKLTPVQQKTQAKPDCDLSFK